PATSSAVGNSSPACHARFHQLANPKIKKGVARPGEVCQIFREYKMVKGA
ncbi:hypothetical protein K443DRAFT_111262, partial [Laccaria amethystina LaAM-08-1]